MLFHTSVAPFRFKVDTLKLPRDARIKNNRKHKTLETFILFITIKFLLKFCYYFSQSADFFVSTSSLSFIAQLRSHLQQKQFLMWKIILYFHICIFKHLLCDLQKMFNRRFTGWTGPTICSPSSSSSISLSNSVLFSLNFPSLFSFSVWEPTTLSGFFFFFFLNDCFSMLTKTALMMERRCKIQINKTGHLKSWTLS